MFLLLVLLFTIIPALEIYLLFSIGDLIGGANTFLIIVITGVLGAALAKRQGMSVLQKVQNNLQSGKIPTSEFIHALLIFGGGVLLLTPGFLTDFLGLSMVFPLTRYMIAIFLTNIFEKSIKNGSTQFYTNMGRGSSKSEHEQNQEIAPGVFEAEFHETGKSEDI